MTVTFSEYQNEYIKFALKHNKKGDCREYTKSDGNVFYKLICWKDDATWAERRELVEEEVEAEAHGIKVKATVKFWKTEFWSTESASKYFYERA